jgi:hypothetical protein
MKLSTKDLDTLRRAADVSDAQMELMELTRRGSRTSSERRNRMTQMIATALAIATISVIAINSFA